MSKIPNRHDDEFLEVLKHRLQEETFDRRINDFSQEKVETLVKMLELEKQCDEKRLEEEHAKFNQRLEAKSRKHKQQQKKRCCRHLAQTAAVMLIFIMAVNFTSHAVADESIFHMISRWTNQFTIRPGVDESNDESSSYQSCDSMVFTDEEDFAKAFGEDFLVCSWVPEGMELEKISSVNVNASKAYLWRYRSRKNKEDSINLRIYERTHNNIAGLTGTELSEGQKVQCIDGVIATVCVNNDGCVAGFEYHDWWYILDVNLNEAVTKTILKGLVKYEK
ncbi:MAG: hypothetical protein Q4F21_00775 [Lachnospiraceae bacterium]|nr:hypothetical protein [Lachnospiraceae bacterium]